MVISVRRRGIAPTLSAGMMPPPRPRSPFGGPPMLQQNAPPAGAMKQPAPQPQPQQSPIQDLFSQQFEKPEMTWSDKLGLISGMLMDYDGTMGSGNADAARARYDQRVQQGQQEHMLQQLGQMPGVTDQQRALLSMGIGAEQLAERAFATGQKPMVVNGRVIDPSDPSKVLADYSDPKLPPGMMVNPETGRPEYIPEYIQGQKAIAEARGGNQNNVQSVFTGEDGMQYIVRRDGSLEPLGVKARNPFQITDVGGVPMAIDRQTGSGIPVTSPETVAQNKATIATVTANEEARRQAQQDLPKAVATFDRGIATLEALKSSPGFDTRYGFMSVIPVIPGTDMADTQALINQIGGQAFLTAFESLKGGGQITEIEGQKATQAITVLTTQGIRPQTAAKAIEDLIEVQRAAKARAASQAQGRYADPGANAPTLKYNPQTGEFE